MFEVISLIFMIKWLINSLFIHGFIFILSLLQFDVAFVEDFINKLEPFFIIKLMAVFLIFLEEISIIFISIHINAIWLSLIQFLRLIFFELIEFLSLINR